MRAYRFGFQVFIATQVVPFVVLFSTKYLFDGSYVDPRMSQLLGLLQAVLALASIFTARGALAAIRGGDAVQMASKLNQSLVLGVAALVTLFYQWGNHMTVAWDRFGETYYTVTGTSAFYFLIALFTMFAASKRVARVGATADNHWDVESAVMFWVFAALAWIATYIVMYLL